MGPSAVSHPEVEVAWSSRGEARRSGFGMFIRREKEKAFSFSVKTASLLWLHRRGQMPETTNRTTEGRGIAGIEDGP